MSCKEPFLPSTGVPITVPLDLKTPEAVILRLKDAYEQRNLALFESIIYSPEEFRYYIEGVNNFQRLPLYIEEDSLGIIIGKYPFYHTLHYDDEVKIHDNMFNKFAEDIYFSASFEVGSRTEYETVSKIDESAGTEYIDTLYALVHTPGAEITISAPQILGDESVSFPIKEQIFCMKQDGPSYPTWDSLTPPQDTVLHNSKGWSSTSAKVGDEPGVSSVWKYEPTVKAPNWKIWKWFELN